jgi:hypothetical protein
MLLTSTRFLSLFSLLFLALFSHAQKVDSVLIYGTVVDQDSANLIPNTHVINKRTFSGTITNGIGEYMIPARIGDTLVFSNVSFQFYYHTVTGKEPENLVIKMKTRNYLLDEVSVTAYKLTSNDPKPMPIGTPMIPKTEDLRQPEPLAPTIANPVDYLYYLFSRRAKQLERLRTLQMEDYYRQKLREGNNREILVMLTGLPREELEAFMFYCKYSDTYINTLNDYEFLISLLNCYEQYERDKTVEKLLNDQETQRKIEQNTDERFRDD